MTAWAWIGIGIAVYSVGAPVIGVIVGRLIRRRERQVPKCSKPTDQAS